MEMPSSFLLSSGNVSHLLLQDMPARRRFHTTPKDRTKRYGIYFPSNPISTHGLSKSDHKQPFSSSSEDDSMSSTWEFCAQSRLSSTPSSNTSTSCGLDGSSAAQRIAYLYRAGKSLEYIESQAVLADCHGDLVRSSTSSDDSTSITDPDPEDATPLDGRKPSPNVSYSDGLEEAREEAYTMMIEDGLGEHEPIVCHRFGCRDMLRDINALMYHLHIHNIAERSYICSDCQGHYETRRELAMHGCRGYTRSPPISPIKESFMRFIAKITCLEESI